MILQHLIRHLRRLACLCAPIVALTITNASAYTVTGRKWPQASLGSPVTVTYSYNNLLDGGLIGPDGVPLPASLIRASVEEAFGLWAKVAPLNFVEVPDEGRVPDFEEYPGGQFGQIRLSHLYINGPDIPGQAPMAKALTYFIVGAGNREGDIFLDDSDPWQKAGTLPTPDVLGAVLHELGHALGLNHSDDPTANMYWIFTRYNGPGTGAALQPDDINGIRSIYGAGVGSVTPLPVPEPATIILAALGGIAIWRRRRNMASVH